MSVRVIRVLSALLMALMLLIGCVSIAMAQDIDLPYELDGSKIENILIEWITPSDAGNDPWPQDKDILYLHPSGDTAQTMMFAVNIALSGQYDYQPGDVEIEIPAYLWKDRDGNPTGTMALSIPEDPETRADFNYRRVGDKFMGIKIPPDCSGGEIVRRSDCQGTGN